MGLFLLIGAAVGGLLLAGSAVWPRSVPAPGPSSNGSTPASACVSGDATVGGVAYHCRSVNLSAQNWTAGWPRVDVPGMNHTMPLGWNSTDVWTFDGATYSVPMIQFIGGPSWGGLGPLSGWANVSGGISYAWKTPSNVPWTMGFVGVVWNGQYGLVLLAR